MCTCVTVYVCVLTVVYMCVCWMLVQCLCRVIWLCTVCSGCVVFTTSLDGIARASDGHRRAQHGRLSNASA